MKIVCNTEMKMSIIAVYYCRLTVEKNYKSSTIITNSKYEKAKKKTNKNALILQPLNNHRRNSFQAFQKMYGASNHGQHRRNHYAYHQYEYTFAN